MKPQTFDEWFDRRESPYSTIDWEVFESLCRESYNAGQKSMEPAVKLLSEIITIVDAAESRNQHPATSVELWDAIDRARELLDGKE